MARPPHLCMSFPERQGYRNILKRPYMRFDFERKTAIPLVCPSAWAKWCSLVWRGIQALAWAYSRDKPMKHAMTRSIFGPSARFASNCISSGRRVWIPYEPGRGGQNSVEIGPAGFSSVYFRLRVRCRYRRIFMLSISRALLHPIQAVNSSILVVTGT